MKFNSQLLSYFDSLKEEAEKIPDDRKSTLSQVRDYIKMKDNNAQVNFICTHNSRRSHFGQVWAHFLAQYHGFEHIKTYSGGTEATAFHPNAIASMERAGLLITKTDDSPNPRYEIRSDENETPTVAFSKVYSHSDNPSLHFLAVMTCSDADENCPFVVGAEKRISLHYEDPKIADGTPAESGTYDERCLQIAAEMYYLFS